MKKRLLLGILLAFSLLLPAGAYDEGLYQQQLSAIGGDALRSAAGGQGGAYLSGFSPSPDADIGTSLATLVERTAGENSKAFHAALRSLTRVMMVVVLCGCAAGFHTAAGGATPAAINMAGALGVTAVLLGDMRGLLALCSGTLEQVSVFSKTMLPVMAAAISLTGAPTTATVMQAATMFAFDLLVRFITAVLVPAVCAYIVLITVNAAMGNDMLERLAAFVKWATTTSLKLILTLFIAYITISGSLGGSVDGIAVKAAKFAVSGSVPVVGGIISDAAETMLSGALLLKNTVGIFGMVCIAAICIVPFFKVGISYLLFKAGSAALSPVCSASLSKLIGGISDSFGLLLGMLGTCSAVLFFELVFSVALVKPA